MANNADTKVPAVDITDADRIKYPLTVSALIMLRTAIEGQSHEDIGNAMAAAARAIAQEGAPSELTMSLLARMSLANVRFSRSGRMSIVTPDDTRPVRPIFGTANVATVTAPAHQMMPVPAGCLLNKLMDEVYVVASDGRLFYPPDGLAPMVFPAVAQVLNTGGQARVAGFFLRVAGNNNNILWGDPLQALSILVPEGNSAGNDVQTNWSVNYDGTGTSAEFAWFPTYDGNGNVRQLLTRVESLFDGVGPIVPATFTAASGPSGTGTTMTFGVLSPSRSTLYASIIGFLVKIIATGNVPETQRGVNIVISSGAALVNYA